MMTQHRSRLVLSLGILSKGVSPRLSRHLEDGATLGRGLAHLRYSEAFSPVPTAFVASATAGAYPAALTSMEKTTSFAEVR